MNKHVLLALFLLGAFAHTNLSCTQTSDAELVAQSFSREALLEDIDFMVAKIEEAHADPYRLISRQDFLELADQLKARIAPKERGRISLVDCYFVFQELAAAIQDEHTEIDFPSKAMPESERFLPFKIGIIEGKLTNMKNLDDARIPRYAELLEINSVSTDKIWEECHKFLNPPLSHAKADLFEKYVPYYLTTVFDLHSPWTVSYRLGNSDVGTITTEGITREELHKELVGSRKYKAYSMQVESKSIPVLDIPSFAFGDFADYRRFMDDFFSTNKNKEALVIDLRRNPGGNGTWGFYLLDFLTNSPYRVVDEFVFKLSDVFLNSGYRNKVSSDLGGAKKGDFLPLNWDPVRSPHNTKNKFSGRVLLLVSHATDSAGVVTAAVFKHHKMGVIIGQETAGRVKFCSDPVLVRLPRTGLKIKIPVAIYALPGENPNRGVIPDIPVARTFDSLRKNNNPVMQKARALLAN